MAFNGSGVFNRIYNWVTDKANTVAVTASRMDGEDDGFATGLSNTICRDGQSTTTARIPFAAGLSAAAGSTSSVSYSQTNDNNTGLYFPAADQFGLVAGGTSVINGTGTSVTITGTLTSTGALSVTGDSGITGTFFVTGDVAIGTSGNRVTINGSSGNTTILGNLAINTNKFTVAAASGNTLVAGTLAVTGASTFGAAVTVSTGGAAITGNSSVTGTLTVSSNFTVSAGSVSLPAASVADAALAAPGSWKLIGAVQTASSSSTIDFAAASYAAGFDGTYDLYELVWHDVKASTDGGNFWLRLGTGGTPTYQSSGYNYTGTGSGAGGTITGTGSLSAAQIAMISASSTLGNDTGEYCSGQIRFSKPNSGNKTLFAFSIRHHDTSANACFIDGAGEYNSGTAITAVRLMPSTGNFASGTFALYGLKKS